MSISFHTDDMGRGIVTARCGCVGIQGNHEEIEDVGSQVHDPELSSVDIMSRERYCNHPHLDYDVIG